MPRCPHLHAGRRLETKSDSRVLLGARHVMVVQRRHLATGRLDMPTRETVWEGYFKPQTGDVFRRTVYILHDTVYDSIALSRQ